MGVRKAGRQARKLLSEIDGGGQMITLEVLVARLPGLQRQDLDYWIA